MGRWVRILDALAKLAIALVGLYATWFFDDAEMRRAEMRLRADDEARLEETFARYYSQIAPVDAGVSDDRAAVQDLALALASRAATQMRDRHGRAELLEFLNARSTDKQAAFIRNVALQAGESADAMVESAPTAQTQHWFAVVGSYSLNNQRQAEAYATEMRQRLSAAGLNYPVAVWRTRVSEVFAVTVGGQRADEADATQLAQSLRAQGLAADAFAQRNRDWTAAPPVTAQ